MFGIRDLCRNGLVAGLNTRVFAGIRAFSADAGGSVSATLAILTPVIIGCVGLAVEASYWQMHQRAMQNASDSAAIAAAMEGNAHYAAVAKASQHNMALSKEAETSSCR
jgi:Flp pilus assembly protein TadG